MAGRLPEGGRPFLCTVGGGEAKSLSIGGACARRTLQRGTMNVSLDVRHAIQLHADGKLTEAVESYRAILKRHPEECACWSNLGVALRTLGRKGEGLQVLREGARICPRVVELNYNLGNALAETAEYEEALKSYRTALNLDAAHRKAAYACGGMLLKLKRYEQAADHCRAMLQRYPDDARLYDGLGRALSKLRHLLAAAVAFRRAIALDPALSFCRISLHGALSALGLYTEDERQLRAVAARDERSPAVLAALAQNLIDQGRLEAGLEYCDAALAIKPDHIDARLGRARANLLAGHYVAAWPDFKWRRHHPAWRVQEATGRHWEGQDIAGQSIVLYGEQGLGDVIQFARFAPLVAERGARVSLYCAPRLVGLLRRLPAVDEVVPSDRPPPPTDWTCSLLDVPGVLGTDLDSIPAACPYLPPRKPPRSVLPSARRFRVSVVWGGEPTQQQDRLRSCRLEDFAPLFELPGAEFVSFQVGPRDRELDGGWRGLVHDPGDALASLEATADALLEVDLVITVDTMLAHLAGALGRPVWTLLPFAPDWRWMLGRADTPWYPSMRLFRQPAPNDWTGVFRDVRRELEARLARAGEAAGDHPDSSPASRETG